MVADNAVCSFEASLVHRCSAQGAAVANLKLALFGPFQLTLDHQPIERFESNKVRALLAFLAVEHHHPHPRDTLTELLWPGHTIDAGRGNFRRALSNLRSVLDDQSAQPPHLRITRETLQFNLASTVTVDVVRFRVLVQTTDQHPAWLRNLEQAMALYRGPFLEGFHADDCQEFELWMTAVRSELDLLAAGALYRLAHHDHIHGEMEEALPLYRRCLTLNPYNEAAQRGLMTALATTGQRGAALAHFTAYRHELYDELRADPETETVELFEAIQQGRFAPVEGARLFTEAQSTVAAWSPHGAQEHTFVGREKELAALHSGARHTAQGRGRVMFVAGEAGSGKTSLVHEFARQLGRDDHPWLVIYGSCTARLGIGDPYQPLVDGLRAMAQNETAMPDTHAASRYHPSEIPPPFANAARLLREQAPDWERLALAGDRAAALVPPAGKPPTPPPAQNSPTEPHGNSTNQARPPPPAALFDQLARFCERLALHHPLLLALDNLHWADAGTIALLFHLAQQLTHSRVLIVGVYRPGALALAETARGHPLDSTVQTLRHQLGATVIDLDQADGRHFVDALVDREPNRLDAAFRDALYHHTEGHALFTAELLHTVRAAGRLSQDQDGCWVESGVLDWDALPARVEALIRERVDHLSPTDHALLNAACVQGDEFHAEIVAAAAGVDEQAVVARLSGELSTAHRLVLPGTLRPATGLPGARYHFRHHLFQTYLYGALDEVQRTRLHRTVGLEMERLYVLHDAKASVTPQELAWHFARAGEAARALDYLGTASQHAITWHAYAEAAGYLSQALSLAPPGEPTVRFELLAAREQAFGLLRDHQAQAQDVGELERLAEQTRDPHHQLVAALRRAALAEQTMHFTEAIDAANAALALAAAHQDPLAALEGHRIAGRAHWWRGELDLARRHYSYALHKAQALPAPDAIGDCLLHLGVACWSLDDLAGAAAAFSEVLDGAVARAPSFQRAAALMGLGMVAFARSDYTRSDSLLDAALTLARELHHLWLEGQVLLNQIALCRQSAAYDRFFAIYDQLAQQCQTIDDRWTAAAAQVEAAALFVQLGAWAQAKHTITQAMVAAEALDAALLKIRLQLLALQLFLQTGESVVERAAPHVLASTTRLGVASILTESWLLAGLIHQREGRLEEATDALRLARAAAQGEVAQRWLPEIVGAQARLALEMGDMNLALAGVEELMAGHPVPLIDQAIDPSSLYLVCYTVLTAAGEPWAEQMRVRGCRVLREQAALITDPALQRSFCDAVPSHHELLTLRAVD